MLNIIKLISLRRADILEIVIFRNEKPKKHKGHIYVTSITPLPQEDQGPDL